MTCTENNRSCTLVMERDCVYASPTAQHIFAGCEYKFVCSMIGTLEFQSFSANDPAGQPPSTCVTSCMVSGGEGASRWIRVRNIEREYIKEYGVPDCLLGYGLSSVAASFGG